MSEVVEATLTNSPKRSTWIEFLTFDGWLMPPVFAGTGFGIGYWAVGYWTGTILAFVFFGVCIWLMARYIETHPPWTEHAIFYTVPIVVVLLVLPGVRQIRKIADRKKAENEAKLQLERSNPREKQAK
jgi:hypothetical protein